MNLFFTSDTHFDHGGIGPDGQRRGILRYRPQFKDLHDMQEQLVERWNAKVPRNATVWHLGDFGFKPTNINTLVERLRGDIHLVLGNHDRDWPWSDVRVSDYGFASVQQAKYLRVDGYRMYLHHYPCRSWRNSSHGSFHLYGHSHGDMAGYNRSMDVGVDAHYFEPVSFEEVRERLCALPDTDHHQKELDDGQ